MSRRRFAVLLVLVVVVTAAVPSQGWRLVGAQPGEDLWEGVHFDLTPPPDAEALLEAYRRQAQPETIFYPDDRIELFNTTDAPWRSIAHLVTIDYSGYIWDCSGTFVNYNVVLTAAHCLDDAAATLVIPGENRFAEPFGMASAYRYSVPVGWATHQDWRYDVALVHLDGAPFGSWLAPYLVPTSYPDSFFANDADFELASAGYPGDKPYGSMWFTGGFQATVDQHFIYSRMDAYPGQSGSAILSIDEVTGSVPIVGLFSSESPLWNRALRMTPLILQALHSYCASEGCTLTTRVIGSAPTPTATSRPPTATPTKPPPAAVTPTTPTKPPTAVVTPTAPADFSYGIVVPGAARN